MKKLLLLLVLTLSFSSGGTFEVSKENRTIGKGYLMLIGGGISQEHADFIKTFLHNQVLLVVPTAFSDKEIKRDTDFTKLRNRFKNLGIDSIQILHTRNRTVANSIPFVKNIDRSNAIFFMGGKTQRILDSYKTTRTHRALGELLERGGLIAGVSAGSGCQASFFNNSEELVEGFGFLPQTVVMNHFLKRDKVFYHSNFFKNNKNYLGLGIDDNTAIIFHKGVGEVLGSSYIAIYDGKYYSRSMDSTIILNKDSDRFYFLQHGDRYGYNTKSVLQNKNLKPISIPLYEYSGSYSSVTNDYKIELSVKKDTLYLKNNWGWKPYPIFPLDNNLFFATNRAMWFKFKRDSSGTIQELEKVKSPLTPKPINILRKEK